MAVSSATTLGPAAATRVRAHFDACFHIIHGNYPASPPDRVHRLPEAGVSVHPQELLFNQAAERLLDELVTIADIVEDIGAYYKEPAIDQQPDL
jgi:hypothetical protein